MSHDMDTIMIYKTTHRSHDMDTIMIYKTTHRSHDMDTKIIYKTTHRSHDMDTIMIYKTTHKSHDMDTIMIYNTTFNDLQDYNLFPTSNGPKNTTDQRNKPSCLQDCLLPFNFKKSKITAKRHFLLFTPALFIDPSTHTCMRDTHIHHVMKPATLGEHLGCHH